MQRMKPACIFGAGYTCPYKKLTQQICANKFAIDLAKLGVVTKFVSAKET